MAGSQQRDIKPPPSSPLLDMSVCPSLGPTPFVAANEPALKCAVHCVAQSALKKPLQVRPERVQRRRAHEETGLTHKGKSVDLILKTVWNQTGT